MGSESGAGSRSTIARKSKIVPLLDDQPAVHEKLADVQLGIERKRPLGSGVREADAHLLAGAVPEHELLAARRLDGQRTARNASRKYRDQQLFHRRSPAASQQAIGNLR